MITSNLPSVILNVEENQEILKLISEQNMIFQAILNSTPSGVAIMDITGKITDVSDALLKIFDAENRSDYIGLNFYQLFPVAEIRNIKSMIRKAHQEGQVQNMEFVISNNNNATVILEVTVALIQDVNGKKRGIMGILRDISRRRRMEHQLIRFERLISLGGMASAMAHEINQPLLSISLGMDNMLLKLEKLNSVERPYFIKKAAGIFGDIARIGRIIDHVKAFSRIQTEEVNTLFNVNDSIKNAVSMIAEQFRHFSIEIDIECDNNLPMIKGDTYMFEQVILNLLNNAKDAMEEKARRTGKFHKQINISTYHKDNCNYVKVRDNGSGIKSKDLDRIMLPFFTTKKVGKGTGLGLSISYSIIKEFNGSIEAENIPAAKGSTGKSVGTCFVISLPV